MATQQVSIKSVLDAIDNLMEQVRTSKLSAARSFERDKALNILGGVRQKLEAVCRTGGGDHAFYFCQLSGDE
jgi:hypothetical protein